MIASTRRGGIHALVMAAGLVLVLGSATTARRPAEADEPATVFLRGGLPTAPSMPPCTPLRVTAGGPNSAKTKLEHAHGRWGPFKLKTKALQDAGQAPTLAECLDAVPEYAGRYDDEQITNLEAGGLTIGMPMEFAIMLMGPPDHVTRRQPAGNKAAVQADEVLWNRPSEFATLKWSPWFTTVWLDATGQTEQLQLFRSDFLALSVSGDPDGTRVSDRGAGATGLRSSAEAQFEYDRTMEAYRSGKHEGVLEALQRLAEEGHPPSQYALGDMYYRGDGVEKDLETATEWIEDAAGSMLPGAFYHLGAMYLSGEDVAQNLVAAYVSMHFAADLGNRDARNAVAQLERQLSAKELATAEEIIATIGVQRPRLLHKINPEYPESAMLERLETSVIVEAIIRTDGTVGVVEILECGTPLAGFEEAAIEALRQWRYKPARWTPTGEPVDVYFIVYVGFKLH